MTNSLGIWVAHEALDVVEVGKIFTHEFYWTNDAASPLRLRSVQASCDCVRVTEFPPAIAAGGIGKIAVQITPKTAGPTDWLLLADVEGQGPPRLLGLSATVEPAGAGKLPEGLTIDAAKLLAANSNLKDRVVVDVRGQEEYRLAHLPGSINLPLFTIKARTFWRSKQLLLVNEGHALRPLLVEAARLQQMHFASVTVLEGGLRSWQLAGGAVEGEAPDSSKWATLSPQQFYNAETEPGWLVVALSTGAETGPRSPLPIKQTLPWNSATLASDLTQLATAHLTAKRLLLVTTDGEHHEEIQTATNPFRSLPVFYLAGGRVAYERFFADHLSQEQRQTITVSSQAQSAKGFQNTPRATVGKRSCCGK